MASVRKSAYPVFVDTGAWIALAVVQDPMHRRAVDAWERVLADGVRLKTSVPVVLETFTFLQRNTRLDIALAWKDSLSALRRFEILECKTKDVTASWEYFRRRDLHKLSAVDATSFVLMKHHRIRIAFTFDHHFATAGFRILE